MWHLLWYLSLAPLCMAEGRGFVLCSRCFYRISGSWCVHGLGEWLQLLSSQYFNVSGQRGWWVDHAICCERLRGGLSCAIRAKDRFDFSRPRWKMWLWNEGKLVHSRWVTVPGSSQGNLLRGDYVLHQLGLSVHQGFKPWEDWIMCWIKITNP